MLLAIAVMIVMVVGVNVLFWRPLTAWAERFRVEESEGAEAPRSLMLDLLRRSRIPRAVGQTFGKLVYPIDRAFAPVGGRRVSAADVGNAPPGRRLGVRRPYSASPSVMACAGLLNSSVAQLVSARSVTRCCSGW